MEDDLTLYCKWKTRNRTTTKFCCQWKMTSFFFVNGRQPPFFGQWRTTSIVLLMEDDLNIFFNGRQPQFCCQWKTTSIVFQMKDNLKFVCK